MHALHAFLALLPAAAILVPLILGHRPGEHALVRMIERRRRPARRLVLAPPPAHTPPALLHVSGGRLIASSLAGRAPPAPVT
jgi:hypothetical protein